MRGVFALTVALASLILFAHAFNVHASVLRANEALLEYSLAIDKYYLRRDLEFSLLKAFEYAAREGLTGDVSSRARWWMERWREEWERKGAVFTKYSPCVAVTLTADGLFVGTSCEITGHIRSLQFRIPRGYGVSVWTGGQ